MSSETRMHHGKCKGNALHVHPLIRHFKAYKELIQNLGIVLWSSITLL